ncbi:MAG TPA: hypothetical protein V6D33_08935 [Cyanophyceae cyanobacterium]
MSDLISADFQQIIFRLPDENYDELTDGQRTSFVDYFGGVRTELNTQRLGFKATIPEPREQARIMMVQLAEIAQSTAYLSKSTAITCYDFHRRITEADWDRGFRIRQGLLYVPQQGGSLSRGRLDCKGQEYYPAKKQFLTKGFSLEMVEGDDKFLGVF